MSENNKNTSKLSALKGIHKAVPIILGAVAALIFACLVTSGSGAFGKIVGGGLLGLFSIGAYVIPVGLVVMAICYADDLENKKILSKVIFFSVATVLVSCIDYAIAGWGDDVLFSPALNFVNANLGGFVGGIFGFLLTSLFGRIGNVIVCIATLAIYLTFLYAERAGSLGKAALSVRDGIVKLIGIVKAKKKAADDKKKQIKAEEDQQRLEANSAELIDDDFFTAKGQSSNVKVKQLGINEELSPSGASSLIDPAKRVYEKEPEPTPVEEKVEHRRRSADKPLDLSYGMEDGELAASDEEEKEEKAPEFNNSFFGIDDSADNVFTKSFDPFDFATSEKAAAKYASKVSSTSAVQEELDEFAIYEMKANHVPTEREKRLMELEARKKEWLYNKQKREGKTQEAVAPAPEAEPVHTEPAAAPVNTVVAQPAPEVAPAAPSVATSTPVHEAPVNPTPSSVNAYTSYSTTKTTYHQPIKTVEFTITKEPKNAQTEIAHQSAPASESAPMGEATEDVAILIAERIAKSNPAYARSANDLKTYTKVISSPDDDLFRQMSHLEEPIVPTVEKEPAEEPAPVSVIAEPEAAVAAEPTLPEAIEFSFGSEEHTAPEVTAQATYQRAAEFASAMVSEPASIDFKTYTPPTAPIYTPVASEPVREESTIKVERDILPPTPAAISFEQPAPAPAPAVAAEPLFTVVDDTNDTTSAVEDEDDKSCVEVSFTDEVNEEIEMDIPEDEDDEDEPTEEMPEEEDAIDEGEIPPEEQNPEVLKMREMFPFLAPLDHQKPTQSEPAVEEEIDDVPFDEPMVAKSSPAPAAALVPVEEKKPEKKAKPDYSDYVFPSLDLLAKEESLYDDNIQAEIQENADKLIETLASFNVTASIKGVDRGPRITRYEVVPAKGVKVSQILNLQDDIALNLAAGSIRMEAPIPGKSAVGIEIPNKKSNIVRLRDLLETEDFQGSKSKTIVCIGRDVAGQPVFGDIAKMPHLLIAGATGMGKSVCINSLLISVLYKAKPDEVKLIMIDPKQVEFTMYNGIPHLLVPVVSDPKQAAGALMWAVEEMERRYNLLNPLCVRNIEAYNEKVTQDPSLGDPMPRIIIVIDEFADLMLQVKDPVETLVMRIAQKARAAGIYLVIGTQRPSVNVITGVIKANVPSRISCKVMSNVDSKTVLDSAGAEKLLDRGDALYAPAGSPKPHRVQCAFVADGEVEAIMSYLRKYSDGTSYDSTVMEEIERAAQKCSKKGERDRDDDGGDESSGEGYLNDRQFLDAVEVAVNTRKISTSLIQRKLSIGYGKAAKFIDIMEDMGIVGEPNGQRPREVLLTPDEWREKLARASLD